LPEFTEHLLETQSASETANARSNGDFSLIAFLMAPLLEVSRLHTCRQFLLDQSLNCSMLLAHLEFVLFLVSCIIQKLLRTKECTSFSLWAQNNTVHQERHWANSFDFHQEPLTGTVPLCPTSALREILLHEKQLYLQMKEPFYDLLWKTLSRLGSLSGKWDLPHCHMLVNTLETTSACNFTSSHQCNL